MGLICFEERWGRDNARFYAPISSKSWKDVYEVQDRCDRVGLGLKIIRAGDDCYLIHQAEVQRHLGSRRQQLVVNEGMESDFREEREPWHRWDRDVEAASVPAKWSCLI